MNNIKAIAFTTDGSLKRMAITYDVIDDEGKVVNSNKKINRVVTDQDVNDHIDAIKTFAETLL